MELIKQIPVNEEDVTQLSDSIFMYPNKRISDRGNVFEGEIRSGIYGVRPCAIKLARKFEQNAKEAEILNKLCSHTHVVSIIQSGICKDMFEERVYIALDKCHEQNLRLHITQRNESGIEFDLNQTVEYSKQIIRGVAYVHESLIIHKDLKPSNVLLSCDRSTIKIADFGLSQDIKSISSKVYCKHQFGNSGFRPLESFGHDWASLKSDTFSLGALLYFLLSNGKSPFGDEITLWIHKTKIGDIDLSDLLVPNPNSFQHLLTLMLRKERCRRPSIWQVADHPCWTGSDEECDFDYDCVEETDDSDEVFAEPNAEESRDSETDTESCRHLLRKLQLMGIINKPANSETSIFKILFFDRTSDWLRLRNPRNKSFTRFQEFNDEMKEKHFSAVSLGNHVYVLTDRSMYRIKYDGMAAAKTWERMNDFDARHGSPPHSVVVAGFIYAVGAGGCEWSEAASRYDSSLNQWERLRNKKLRTSDSSIVASNATVYSIGGHIQGLGETDRVERLNLVSHTWDEVAPMTESRWRASAVECNGKIIIAGGWDRGYRHLKSVESFDPDKNQWTNMKPMMKSRAWFRLHLIEGNIFSVGGDREEKTIEKFDSSDDRWEIIDLGTEMKIYESITVRTNK